jgi:nucleoside-diphosphate-sugar epimerase
MKTVVTGGAGFIGSNLVRALLDQGREVTIADDFSRGSRINLSDLDIKAKCLELDLRNYNSALQATAGADIVFHLAARVGSVDSLHGSEMIELEALQTNLLIDANVFRACLQNGVKKIIYTSSVSVYPIHLQDRPGAIFSENDCLIPNGKSEMPISNPEGGYGWAKFIGEIQLSWLKGIKVGIARIFSAYGENGKMGKNPHVVLSLIRKAIRYPNEEFTVWGDGSRTRDFLYVADVISALLKLEEQATTPPVIVNIGGSHPVSIKELAETVIRISGKDMKIMYDLSKPVGPFSRTSDNTKAKNLLGWETKTSLEDGLRRTYAWEEKRLSVQDI